MCVCVFLCRTCPLCSVMCVSWSSPWLTGEVSIAPLSSASSSGSRSHTHQSSWWATRATWFAPVKSAQRVRTNWHHGRWFKKKKKCPNSLESFSDEWNSASVTGTDRFFSCWFLLWASSKILKQRQQLDSSWFSSAASYSRAIKKSQQFYSL